ncbi:MAG: DUF1249 domain-containing protein [Gammaproteobacteria bacterium]|jgi:hypothetical protein|nr:DUF1249 domain-containing protein [Gammaproteobacteria bacterium]MBT4606770.1 DUF1249 domain-containing protein [Thiotrichales bacterium]MBT3471236.1 DUF1249 domain-containing protein [Gammaproteobacteria bacterium]MBT3966112.1 DUF1249 domain-containing protein [Gammaproteobacteria bacterium]MBT4081361.1 DUF1249 domain-containing protein [Gammaproteobacteria bacterium]
MNFSAAETTAKLQQRERSLFMRKLVRHNLTSLMGLYEENSSLLFRLIPEIRSLEVGSEQQLENPLPLILKIQEQSPYTTTLNLTHRFIGESGEEEEPSAKIRLYYDSDQAEVLSMSQGESLRSFLSLIKSGEENLDARWRLNLFLNHWLRYCLEQGYQF